MLFGLVFAYWLIAFFFVSVEQKISNNSALFPFSSDEYVEQNFVCRWDLCPSPDSTQSNLLLLHSSPRSLVALFDDYNRDVQKYLRLICLCVWDKSLEKSIVSALVSLLLVSCCLVLFVLFCFLYNFIFITFLVHKSVCSSGCFALTSVLFLLSILAVVVYWP